MKKFFLFGMAFLLFASSLAMISCGSEGGGGSNRFAGTWTSSSPTPATLKFGSSDWTLTIPSLNVNAKGNYSFPTSADHYINLFQNGSTVGQATISGSTMGLQILTPSSFGSYTGGQFSK